MRIIFLLVSVIFLFSKLFGQSLENKKQQLQTLESEISEKDKQLKKTAETIKKEKDKFSKTDQELKKSAKKIDKLSKTEKEKKSEIEKALMEISDRQGKIYSIRKECNILFKNLFYEEFSSLDQPDNQHYLAKIINLGADKLNSLYSEKEKYELKKGKEELDYQAIQRDKKLEVSRKEKYSNEITSLKKNISQLEKDKNEIKVAYEKLKQEAEALQSLINKLQVNPIASEYSYKFSAEKLRWPAFGEIFKPFGELKDKTTNLTLINNGIDISVKEGTEISCVDAGIVSFSEWYEGAGKLIIIDHQNGFHTLYSHNSSLLVSKGDEVKKNQVIALSGKTGSAERPSLHFEVRKDGRPVNPLNYLE